MPVNDDDSRFRVCCCHVRTCTLVIAILEVLGLLSMMVTAMQRKAETGTALYSSSIVNFVATLIVAPLLIFGVLKEKPVCLLPHIVVQILQVIGALIGGIVLIVSGVMMTEEAQEKKEAMQAVKTVLIATGVALLIGALIQIFFTHVVVRCYRYLKEKVG